MGTETRQRDKQIKIRLNETEYSRIVALSKQHDLAPSTFLRELGLMHQPRSTIDAQAVERITRLHGDLGRTAGLLKLWLTTPESSPPSREIVNDLIAELQVLKVEIVATLKRL